MEKLRNCTLGAVREEMKKEDEELAVKMENLQFLTVDNLDVAMICKQNEETMLQVRTQLQHIQDVFSPGEKVFIFIILLFS